eukprot:2128429-Rhodomonas_salina.1
MSGKHRLALGDIIMVLLGCTRAQANNMMNNALVSVDHGEKAHRLLHTKFQFPGRGQHPTWVVTIDEALEFLDCLPDCYTDDIKAYIRTQFLRVTGGDPTLHDEIDLNAKSTGVIQQIAREA